MLRPTRSRLVTETDIVRALRQCNMLKTKSFHVQIVGISGFASWEAPTDWLMLEPSPRLRIDLDFQTNIAAQVARVWSERQNGHRLLRNKASPVAPWPRPKPFPARLCRTPNSTSKGEVVAFLLPGRRSRSAAIGTLIAWKGMADGGRVRLW